jgi:TatD DNase family protein
MIVDSHCHLDYPGLAEREAEVVAAAAAAGVGMMLTIATRRAAWSTVCALAERHPAVVCALGVHPHHAGAEGLDDPAPLVAAAGHPKVVAIGESGLDYHYDFAPRDRQAASFRMHVEAARRTGLPLIVHTREADVDTMAMLEDELARGRFGAVIHCYSSSRALAERAVAAGFYLGIGGILTFPRSDELRATVAAMPLDRLLLETDAPYLAPVPQRGRTNEPAFTVHTAKRLAELRGLPLGKIEAATTANFFRLFPKAAPFAAAA